MEKIRKKTGLRALCLLSAAFATAPLQAGQPSSPAPSLGTPLTAEEAVRRGDGALRQRATLIPKSSATGGFSLPALDRFSSRAFFRSIYQASPGTPMGWTGSVGGCLPGTTDQAYKDAVLLRINYFRAMAGVPADIAFNPLYNDKAQSAALMMSANDQLSHTPPSGWGCWSADGIEAAGSSNLSLGYAGWDAVQGQMEDNGANNSLAGHRRWLLYPQTREMGTGDVPDGGGFRAANAVWVFDGRFGDPRPATREAYVAWPPPGAVPYQVTFPRWSFSYPDADFSGATVTMQKGGAAVPVAMESVANGYGENSVVWVPEGLDANLWNSRWPKPVSDAVYTVNINNVLIGGVLQNFGYQVTVFDPALPGAGEVTPVIHGDSQPAVGSATNYTFDLIPNTVSYELRSMPLAPYTQTEGAESGPSGVVDGTDAGYPLIANDVSAAGNASFHLAHPNAHSQYFELDRALLLSGSSSLSFQSRLGWANPSQVARAQISVDDGASWIELWSQAGSGGAGESGFTQRSIPLSSYQDSVARFRFAYDFDSGSYCPQTSAGVGFYVDEIVVTHAEDAGAGQVTPLDGSGSFSFTPAAAQGYGLQIRPVFWQGFPFPEWGPAFRLQAAVSPPSPDITVNGGDGPLTVAAGDPVDIQVGLSAGSRAGSASDWWIIARTPFGFYFYRLGQGWTPVPGPFFTGALFDLPPVTILSSRFLPTGDYAFFFAVDDNQDGVLDATYLDFAVLTIQ